jgi:hypothetical protein
MDVARKDFVEVFGGDDPQMLADHLAGVKRVPTAGYEDGFRATVLAIQCAQAVAGRKRIVFENDWFELS